MGYYFLSQNPDDNIIRTWRLQTGKIRIKHEQLFDFWFLTMKICCEHVFSSHFRVFIVFPEFLGSLHCL